MQASLNFDQISGFGKLLQSHLSTAKPLDKSTVEAHIKAEQDFKHRDLLVKTLNHQYNGLSINEAVRQNISLLSNSQTFCVTTGHQLSLLGGPLFVTYKILTTVKLAIAYKKLLPAYDFVPVFWMATEDHDKEEINHFYYKGQKYTWETAQTGAVGRFSCDGILPLLENFRKEFPGLPNTLFDVFEKAYQQATLAAATRYLVNALFGHYGVVIIDGDDRELKKLFIPVAQKEISENFVHAQVTEKNKTLQKNGFEPAISPREINLFVHTENDRKRIEIVGENVKTADGSLNWTKADFIRFIHEHPEQISPNVLLRPVYQELILPNIAYVGGPAETEYWLQLDGVFKTLGMDIPERVLRICATVISQQDAGKIDKSGIAPEVFMGNEDLLIKAFLQLNASETLDFTNETETLEKLFGELAQKAKQVDPTLEPAVMAEKARQEKALENIFGRIRKAEKSRHEVDINRLKKLRNQLLPAGQLQERIYGLADLNTTDLNGLFERVTKLPLGLMNLLETE